MVVYGLPLLSASALVLALPGEGDAAWALTVVCDLQEFPVVRAAGAVDPGSI